MQRKKIKSKDWRRRVFVLGGKSRISTRVIRDLLGFFSSECRLSTGYTSLHFGSVFNFSSFGNAIERFEDQISRIVWHLLTLLPELAIHPFFVFFFLSLLSRRRGRLCRLECQSPCSYPLAQVHLSTWLYLFFFFFVFMVFTSNQMANVDDGARWLHPNTDLLSGHGVSYAVNVNLFVWFIEQ